MKSKVRLYLILGILCLISYGMVGVTHASSTDPLPYTVISENITLNEDRVYESLQISSGTFDLNGHNLTIKGDLYQRGGTLYINGGSVHIGGNYIKYSDLKMINEKDYILIDGVFYNDSENDSTGYLTAGLMEVKGDFNGRGESFNPTGTHKVKLSGTNGQHLFRVHLDLGECRFNSLEFANTSADGITIDYLVDIYGELKVASSDVKVTDTGLVRLCQKAIINGEWPGNIVIWKDWQLQQDQVIAGDLMIHKGTVDVNGKSLTVKGNLLQQGGTLNINGGSVHIEGNHVKRGNSYLKMVNEKDYILIDGVFYTDSENDSTGYLTAGLMEVKGDFNGRGESFNPTGTHKVKLSGTNGQHLFRVHLDHEECRFNSLEFANTSADGITIDYPVAIYGELKAASNNVKVAGIGVYLCQKAIITGEWQGNIVIREDWQLQQDQVIAGDLMIYKGTVDVNGKSLTVKGNLVQQGGTLNINGGSVHIEGNHAKRGNSYLKMVNERDYLLIDEVFYTDSENDSTGSLTAGLMEVKGHFKQEGSKNAFNATGTHKVKLSGSSRQEVYFQNPDTSKFNILILTKPLDTGYSFNTTPVWNVLK